MNKLIEDVKMSLELEEKGYRFYTETSKRTKNPLAIATLDSLAARELFHKERVKRLYEKLTGNSTADISIDGINPSRAELLRPILEKLKGKLEAPIETIEEINKAYIIAEGLERDSFTLYKKIAGENADTKIKVFFNALAAEEEEHYAILDETLEYLNNPGDWYRKQEHWIVEG